VLDAFLVHDGVPGNAARDRHAEQQPARVRLPSQTAYEEHSRPDGADAEHLTGRRGAPRHDSEDEHDHRGESAGHGIHEAHVGAPVPGGEQSEVGELERR
jgi:hypothetical protein